MPERISQFEIAPVLVRVRVADHHLLDAALPFEDGAHEGKIEPGPHHFGAGAQILDRLEQRDDAQRGLRFFSRREEARFLHQGGGFEKIRDAFGARDDVVGDGAFAEQLLEFGRLVGDLQLALRLLGIMPEGRAQQPRAGKFAQQERNAFGLAEGEIGRHRAGSPQQLVEHALVDFRVLAQVHGRQMEAEGADRFAQIEQPAVREVGVAAPAQGVDDDGEIGREFLRRPVGFGFPARR